MLLGYILPWLVSRNARLWQIIASIPIFWKLSWWKWRTLRLSEYVCFVSRGIYEPEICTICAIVNGKDTTPFHSRHPLHLEVTAQNVECNGTSFWNASHLLEDLECKTTASNYIWYLCFSVWLATCAPPEEGFSIFLFLLFNPASLLHGRWVCIIFTNDPRTVLNAYIFVSVLSTNTSFSW